MLFLHFVTFPYGVPGKIWYVIVSISGFSFFLVIRCACDLEIIFQYLFCHFIPYDFIIFLESQMK